ncbi:hypothetical protein NG701_02465 [Pseudarthrobacter sp. HLT3-5]|uniref:hypothetical protein n=1 Tax=Pseudarthrobacter cellobiosi TaxID=2953654 RepID=UPI00208DF373|nr:hypothetical protein [Pseudarthrobacter sp. HLT3-5]MCO4273299.1 hypothetical protein [Pseudarthrobacter sp. HLT3-5]
MNVTAEGVKSAEPKALESSRPLSAKTEEYLLSVVVTDPAMLQEQLSAAMAQAQTQAQSRRRGLMLTRHNATFFEVQPSAEVDFRTTLERDLWSRA